MSEPEEYSSGMRAADEMQAEVEHDPEAQAQADAEHETFLETYQPVITRLPEALAAERAEQVAAEEAALAVTEQAEADRNDLIQRAAEQQAQDAEEKRAYAEQHYPGTVS